MPMNIKASSPADLSYFSLEASASALALLSVSSREGRASAALMQGPIILVLLLDHNYHHSPVFFQHLRSK